MTFFFCEQLFAIWHPILRCICICYVLLNNGTINLETSKNSFTETSLLVCARKDLNPPLIEDESIYTSRTEQKSRKHTGVRPQTNEKYNLPLTQAKITEFGGKSSTPIPYETKKIDFLKMSKKGDQINPIFSRDFLFSPCYDITRGRDDVFIK